MRQTMSNTRLVEEKSLPNAEVLSAACGRESWELGVAMGFVRRKFYQESRAGAMNLLYGLQNKIQAERKCVFRVVIYGFCFMRKGLKGPQKKKRRSGAASLR